MNQIINAMTVDVEDYFQVSAFDKFIMREDWDTLPGRVETNIDKILQLFEKHDVKGTFFTLGWIAERYPEMMRRIASSGHEIASHGYEHIRVTRQDHESFREDITKTKKMLEDITGKPVIGYRAASFSIDSENHWAHEILETVGYQYSSSIYPIRHDLYGIPGGIRFIYQPANGQLYEIPVSTLKMGSHRFPCGGGGYFRLLPYILTRSMIKHINNKENKSCIFYFHPWEIDPGQPKVQGLTFKARFRHYSNLGRMESKLEKILQEFNWGTMREIYIPERQSSKLPGTSTTYPVDQS